ncbi:MAG TPA: hypothetical protein DCR97_12355 [Deltaproteobacteria bacterium]|nr:hypothetical protein [Deltaproteobacteria bacterium]
MVKKWKDRIPVCVAYPNTYYVGMSNLAVHLLYSTLNGMSDVVCERIFLEPGKPPRSVESGHPLKSFELVFFTFSFEMDYPNLVRGLKDASIHPIADERTGREPLVIAGGMCVMANPEPISPFVDLFVMGDIETTLSAMMERYRTLRGKRRQEVLDGLSAWPWMYNPRGLEVGYNDAGTVRDFNPEGFAVEIARYRGVHLASSAIVSDKTEFSDMLLLEGTRGCPSRCPFCLTGNTNRFLHERREELQEGIKDVGIIGGGVSFHPDLAGLIRGLKEKGLRVHLPSLRVDEVSLEVIDLIRDEVKTLTFGIEAGTERLRALLGKPVKDDELYAKIEAIAALKSFHLKLYFMIGVPSETAADVERIVGLAKHAMNLMIKQGAKRGSVGSITVHASPFVPKAATPFQWLPMADMKDLKAKINLLKRGLARVPNTYFTHESVKYSFVQAVFSRGDRRLQGVISSFAEEDHNLTRIMRESPINLNFYATRQRGKDEVFPWDFIKGVQSKKQLYTRLLSVLPADAE